MANFNQHHTHALENLHFLQLVNDSYPTEFRWQITVCFYSSLHLFHAYVSAEINGHPETHEDLKRYLSPNGVFKNTRLPKHIYSVYEKLEILSRKARYKSDLIITEKHFYDAVVLLDSLILFFNNKYPSSKVSPISIQVDDSKFAGALSFVTISERIKIEESK